MYFNPGANPMTSTGAWVVLKSVLPEGRTGHMMISFRSRLIIGPGHPSPSIDFLDPYTNNITKSLHDTARLNTTGGVTTVMYNGTLALSMVRVTITGLVSVVYTLCFVVLNSFLVILNSMISM
jgi:hypothetical protein